MKSGIGSEQVGNSSGLLVLVSNGHRFSFRSEFHFRYGNKIEDLEKNVLHKLYILLTFQFQMTVRSHLMIW